MGVIAIFWRKRQGKKTEDLGTCCRRVVELPLAKGPRISEEVVTWRRKRRESGKQEAEK